QSRSALALPGDRQCDVGKRRLDGGIRFVDRDAHPFNTIVQEADVRNALGQGLDQIHRIFLDGGLHRVHETSVVHGVAQVVGAGRRAGVDAQREVDHEGLALPSLEVEDAVAPEALDAEDGKLVAHDFSSSLATTRSASWLARTSCTRIPQTPAWA